MLWCVLYPVIQICADMENKNTKIFVAGHRGLVGSAIVRALEAQDYTNIIVRSRKELDLLDAEAVYAFFKQERPDYVFIAAAKVGGILANATLPAEFLYENLAISMHIIDAAYRYGVKKLLYLGSSCIYPRDCPQPIKESFLLTGPLEPTNRAYAIAKIAGIELCMTYNKQYNTHFIACMPTNLYGPGDNFDLQTSHVLPALLRKIYEAKRNHSPFVIVWGTGKPLREFLYVDDLADACIFLMRTYNGDSIVNVGTGKDISIHELALLIASIVGYTGTIIFDSTKPDGTPRKVLDVGLIHTLGWYAKTSIVDGICKSFAWFLEHYKEVV
jgi:GDP-L-fucose synthase